MTGRAACRLKSKRYGADNATRSDVFLETLEANTRIVSQRQAQEQQHCGFVLCLLVSGTEGSLSLSAHVGSTAGPLMAARHALFSRYPCRMTSSAPVSSVASIPENCSRGMIHLDCGAPHSPRPALVVSIAGLGFLWRTLLVAGPQGLLAVLETMRTRYGRRQRGRLLGFKFYRISLCAAALSPNLRIDNWVAAEHARPRSNY